MIYYWLKRSAVDNRIYIPKYYDPNVINYLKKLEQSHELISFQELIDRNIVEVATGNEIGKMAYGTGDIPFVRTSDISNWEIKTIPKQGVSEVIYREYAESQDVRVGDILLVRDGTYLIGTNCIITNLDSKILYQSHILKFRVKGRDKLDPYLLFLLINSNIVQSQIRSVQFTADTIDTIGNRYLEVVLPIPRSSKTLKLVSEAKKMLEQRERGKAFIKQSGVIIEEVLKTNSLSSIEDFKNKSWEDILSDLKHDTISAEFGFFETFWKLSGSIKDRIYLPKYYDPEILKELAMLKKTCDCISINELEKQGIVECNTGDEIGKMAYGTGDIPFIRTSDFSNWEIKHDPKQSVSQEIYDQYKTNQDVMVNDVLLVRDGTYLVGSSCIITEFDCKVLYCGGLYKIRVINGERLNPWLLLGLLNSYVVKRQIRTKQFTRDVIDTLGKRLLEIILPIPKSEKVRVGITEHVKKIISSRMEARQMLTKLSQEIIG